MTNKFNFFCNKKHDLKRTGHDLQNQKSFWNISHIFLFAVATVAIRECFEHTEKVRIELVFAARNTMEQGFYIWFNSKHTEGSSE